MDEELSVRVTYLSHSCFEVQDIDHTLLIDPFFSKENPNAPKYVGKPDIVLVTHEHFDHVTAEKFTATVVVPPTLAGRFHKTTVMEHGQSRLVEGVPVTMIGASHHQSKYPSGYVFELGGVRFAHLGDTYLDGVKPLENVGVLFIPIGGFFTMDVEEALEALDIIKPDAAIPMHFNTFSNIKADPQRFKQRAEKAGHSVTVLSIGATAAF
ncbi:MAG TPA: MBL fold metallo-hydrolase [Candidatus Bathyarchaeia archaeon]|nr:MBL fold metallo-hydrolase [Candidatus Bathyarchaeia archaeon]